MNQHAPSVECLVRQAFGLVLEIRGRPEAHGLLVQVVAFLKTLVRAGGQHVFPLVIRVEAVRIHK